MRMNKVRNRKNIFLIACACALAIGGLAWYMLKSGQSKDKLQRAGCLIEDGYDTSTAEVNWKDTLKEQELSCVFWIDSGKKNIENTDYHKSLIAKTIVVCGNSAILFPDENYVSEEGYCLLGKEVAVKLFGSTSVNGRSIYVDGKEYSVAGVLKEQKDIAVIASDEGIFQNVSYLYHNDFEKGKNLQIIESLCGSRLSESN